MKNGKNHYYVKGLLGICATLALSSCGMVGIGANQGLFADEFAQTSLSRPNDLQGTWELDDGYQSSSAIVNSSSAYQQTYGYTVTKTRVRVDSVSSTMLKLTTRCERRDPNDVNKLQSTYVNADLWVLIEPNAGYVAGGAVSGVVNGRITINSFRNTDISGEKGYVCTPSLDTGVYSYTIADGRLYMSLVSPINSSNQVVAQTTSISASSSFRKIRD